jgi:hypothetical protein
MKKIIIVVLVIIILVIGIYSGCEGTTSASNEPIIVQGKIVDFKPGIAFDSSSYINIVYLTFDTGDVYCVGLSHFKLNTTVKLKLEKYSNYLSVYGDKFYEVKEYYEPAESG